MAASPEQEKKFQKTKPGDQKFPFKQKMSIWGQTNDKKKKKSPCNLQLWGRKQRDRERTIFLRAG